MITTDKIFDSMVFLILPFLLVLSSLTFSDPSVITASDNYGFLWWAEGFEQKFPLPSKHVNIQTGDYGLSLDVEKADIVRFGPLDTADSIDSVLGQYNEVIQRLPASQLVMTVTIGETVYTCNGQSGHIAEPQYLNAPYRLINSGRFVQRYDILDLIFEDSSGQKADIEARLEIISWPDSLTLLLEITPTRNIQTLKSSIILNAGKQNWIDATQSYKNLAKGNVYKTTGSYFSEDYNYAHTSEALSISAKTTTPLPVHAVAEQGCFVIDIPTSFFSTGQFPESIETCEITLKNSAEREMPIKLFFRTDFPADKKMAIVNTMPLLTDASGHPTGAFIQISKNWHRPKKKGNYPPYVSGWFYTYTMFNIAKQSELKLKLKMINGVWGNVPSVSHSQLSLLGWGGNQLWEQVAIGNWGESICYDPDINLMRGFIDDMRPLMVWSIGNQEKAKWGWTNNVGGGNFLVYDDEHGNEQKLICVKTYHRKNGPNLTETVYRGITRDGAIAVTLTVSTPRSDDINRSFHTFRYDILKPLTFTRLALYQLGADRYNINDFDRLAIGNTAGLVEEWKPQKGGKTYHRKAVACRGKTPWFSFHQTKDCAAFARRKGVLANRGLIIRDYAARLKGKKNVLPYASCYGTEDRIPSSNVELSLPPEVTTLEPGDFIQAHLELIVLPQFADDYYGPNQPLKTFLEKHEDTWRPVHREAVGNDLDVQVSTGNLIQSYPVVIDVRDKQTAVFSVSRGVGYVPITFTGLPSGKGYRLVEIADEKEMTLHDNKNYQLDKNSRDASFHLTHNINLDSNNPLTSHKTLKFYHLP